MRILTHQNETQVGAMYDSNSAALSQQVTVWDKNEARHFEAADAVKEMAFSDMCSELGHTDEQTNAIARELVDDLIDAKRKNNPQRMYEAIEAFENVINDIELRAAEARASS